MTKSNRFFMAVLFVLIVGFAFVGCENGTINSVDDDDWNFLKQYDTGNTIFGIPYVSKSVYSDGKNHYSYRIEVSFSNAISQINTYKEFQGYQATASGTAGDLESQPDGIYINITPYINIRLGEKKGDMFYNNYYWEPKRVL